MIFKSLEYLQKSNEGLLEIFGAREKCFVIDFDNKYVNTNIIKANTEVGYFEKNKSKEIALLSHFIKYIYSPTKIESWDIKSIIKRKHLTLSKSLTKKITKNVPLISLGEVFVKNYSGLYTHLVNNCKFKNEDIENINIKNYLEKNGFKLHMSNTDESSRKEVIKKCIKLCNTLLQNKEYHDIANTLTIMIEDSSSDLNNFLNENTNEILFFEIDDRDIWESPIMNKFINEFDKKLNEHNYQLDIAGDGDEGLVNLTYVI